LTKKEQKVLRKSQNGCTFASSIKSWHPAKRGWVLESS